jgi:hypothetical protein
VNLFKKFYLGISLTTFFSKLTTRNTIKLYSSHGNSFLWVQTIGSFQFFGVNWSTYGVPRVSLRHFIAMESLWATPVPLGSLGPQGHSGPCSRYIKCDFDATGSLEVTQMICSYSKPLQHFRDIYRATSAFLGQSSTIWVNFSPFTHFEHKTENFHMDEWLNCP